MKQLILLSALFFCSLQLAGQPTEFAPAPCNGDAFSVMFYQTFLGDVDGNPVEPGVDWVAAIDAQGYVIGLEQVTSISGFGCPALPALAMSIDGEVTNAFLGCPPPPYGGSANESIDIVIYDVSRDLFFSLPSPVTYQNQSTIGTANTSSGCAQEDFTVPYTVPTNPLPVVLTAFRGQLNDRGQVELGWTTIQEQNSDIFSIEHSRNGEVWRPIGQVTAAGNSQGERNYQFIDATPNNGQNLYRLRQVDFDGSFYYSEVVSVNLATAGVFKEAFVYPNPPVGNRLTLTLSGNWGEEATSSLSDISGRQVATWANVSSGTNTIDLPNLPAGVYQLVTSDATTTTTIRVVLR